MWIGHVQYHKGETSTESPVTDFFGLSSALAWEVAFVVTGVSSGCTTVVSSRYLNTKFEYKYSKNIHYAGNRVGLGRFLAHGPDPRVRALTKIYN